MCCFLSNNENNKFKFKVEYLKFYKNIENSKYIDLYLHNIMWDSIDSFLPLLSQYGITSNLVYCTRIRNITLY